MYKKKTRYAILRRNFMFQLATELRKVNVQRKTAQVAAVLLPLFNNSYQYSIVDGSKKRKQCQVNVNCEQSKTAKFCCGCRRSVCRKCTDCVKVKCVDCVERSKFSLFLYAFEATCGQCKQQHDEKLIDHLIF